MANLIRPHQPCEDCGSHDAKSYYDDGSSYCFSCNKFRKASGEVSVITEEEFEKKLLESIEKGKFRDIPDRGITKATCERYGVRTIQKNGVIVEHKYPYQDAKGNRVATKTRVVETKEFYSEGNMKGCALFGQVLFPSSGKYITVTEGECFKEDTEVLTRSGWVSLRDYSGGPVMDGEGDFTEPLCKIEKDYEGSMCKVATKFLNIDATSGHNIIYRTEKGTFKKPFKDTPCYFKVPLTVDYDCEGIDLSDDLIRILVAISADGTIDVRKEGRKYVRISFIKERKINRMRDLLKSVGIFYHEGVHKSGHTCFCFNLQEAFKEFPKEWMTSLSRHQRNVLLQELQHWDGYKPKTREQIEYYTTSKANADFVQTLAHLSGYYGGICVKNYKQDNWRKGYTVRICFNQNTATCQGDKKTYEYSGKVYCVQMPSGSLLCRCNGRIFVCGNCDCLSVYQMFGGLYPVVSVPSGATSKKAVEDNYEWLCGFDNIILCWDADKTGQRAVKEIAQMLPPEKVKIVKLEPTMKDPNEYLKAGKVQEFISRWWRAEEYRPDDLVNIGDMFERVKDYRKTHNYIATPWSGLNDMIAGTRAGQLVVLAAGSGQGKSAFLRTWMDHLVKTTETHIGALYMEEKPEETVISLMSLRAGRNLKKPEVWDLTTEDELKKFFEDCGANRRIELFDPLMSASPEYILEKIRYMYQARKCSVIFLDHLTYLVDDSDDVRRDLNKLCKGLHDLCVSLGITVIAACHLRKATDARHSHEEGGRVTLDDLKDSSSIKQLSDIVIGLERDSQADNPTVANTTTMRVLKSRDFGQKGVACGCIYDKDTTRLQEIDTESLHAMLGGDEDML